MIAVDTNILVYSHRQDSPWYAAADEKLTGLAESGSPWAIPWPSIHEFVAVVTHPGIYRPATPRKDALQQVAFWLECPSLHVIGEVEGYWDVFRSLVLAGKVSGPAVHDARVAAICLQHGVKTLWSADRDFSRFPRIKAVNPLIETRRK